MKNVTELNIKGTIYKEGLTEEELVDLFLEAIEEKEINFGGSISEIKEQERNMEETAYINMIKETVGNRLEYQGEDQFGIGYKHKDYTYIGFHHSNSVEVVDDDKNMFSLYNIKTAEDVNNVLKYLDIQ